MIRLKDPRPARPFPRVLGLLLALGVLAGCGREREFVTRYAEIGDKELPREVEWTTATPDYWAIHRDARGVWVVGEGGTIVHSADGVHWERQYTQPDLATLQDVHGSGDGRLWAVGMLGTIVYSSDGVHWQRQESDAGYATLRAIHEDAKGRLWAVGSDGTIVHSTDGLTWRRQQSGVGGAALWAIHGDSGGHLWVVGTSGTILHSNDGVTWQLQESQAGGASLYAIHGDTRGRLWAVGDLGTIVHSTDGATWQHVDVRLPSIEAYTLRVIFQHHDGRLWAAGDMGLLLQSTDGVSWRELSLPSNLIDFWAIDGGRAGIVAVGEDGAILHSTDGGSLEEIQSPAVTTLFAVLGDRDSGFWAVGEAGTILGSPDGVQWRRHDSGAGDEILWSIHGNDQGHLWAVGADQTILQSSDCTHWELRHRGMSGTDLMDLVGDGEGRLWAVGRGGTIFHSGDGVRWKHQDSQGTRARLRAIYGDGHGRLWAVGEAGAIVHSSDGRRWRRLESSANGADLEAIFGDDRGRLWAVGSDGTIVQSNDGVVWRRQQTEAGGADLLALHGDAEGRAWVVGRGGTILHSPDGVSWRRQESRASGAQLSAIYGDSEGGLWAVGNAGTIVHSRDGQKWRSQESGASASDLGAIAEDSLGRLWAVGDAQTILYSYDGLTWRHSSTTHSGYQFNALHAGPAGNLCAVGGTPWSLSQTGRIWAGQPRGPRQPTIDRLSVTGGTAAVRLAVQVRDPDDRCQGACTVGFSVGRAATRDDDETYRPLPTTATASEDWEISFDPTDPALGEYVSGQTMTFRMRLDAPEGFVQEYGPRDFVSPPELVFDRWRAVRESWWIGLAAMPLLAYLLLFALRPAWVLRLGAAVEALKPAAELAGKAVGMAFSLPMLFLDRWLTRHPRVLDAWVSGAKHAVGGAYRHTLERSGVRPYVSLPMEVERPDGSRSTVLVPSPGDLAALFRERRVVLEVLGPGGAGKTTLAAEIGRWALGGRLSSQGMLPVWVDEDFDDLPALVEAKLRSWLPDDPALGPRLVEALLAEKRLLVLVDRLSERAEETAAHVRTVHREAPVHALLVTTRVGGSWDGVAPAVLRPEPLRSDRLVFFIAHLLAEAPAGGELFPDVESQLQLPLRAARLIGGEVRSGGMSPLLVRLFTEKAVALKGASGSLDGMPESVPALYAEYVRGLNPKGSDVARAVRDEVFLAGAEALSVLALKGTYRPGSFGAESAVDALIATGEFQDREAARRLMDSYLRAGVVLHQHDVGAEAYYRIALDPLAESLAASQLARRCGTRRESWRRLLEELRDLDAQGILEALRAVCTAYGPTHGWPGIEELEATGGGVAEAGMPAPPPSALPPS